MSRRKQIIKQNEISRMYSFSLGGYDQKVLIEGKKKDLPVVLFLHGGPGTPIPFNAGCRGLFPAFTDRFIMVYWDQLGCGINNRELEDSLTVSSFTAMAADLIREIKNLFPANRLFLFAVSWGSVLSAKLLEKKLPVDGVVVCGQITHDLFFNSPLIHAVEQSRMPREKKDRILELKKQSLQQEDLQFLSSSLQKYTDAYNNHQGKQPPVGPLIWGMLTSPDYRLRDLKALMINGYTDNPALFFSLFRELLQADLTGALKEAAVPYHIIQGDTDVVATTEYVRELADSAGNPNLTCEVIKNTGHFPNGEAMERILQALTELAERKA